MPVHFASIRTIPQKKSSQEDLSLTLPTQSRSKFGVHFTVIIPKIAKFCKTFTAIPPAIKQASTRNGAEQPFTGDLVGSKLTRVKKRVWKSAMFVVSKLDPSSVNDLWKKYADCWWLALCEPSSARSEEKPRVHPARKQSCLEG